MTEAEARALAEERAEKRRQKDFAAADQLRERIRELGANPLRKDRQQASEGAIQ